MDDFIKNIVELKLEPYDILGDILSIYKNQDFIHLN